MKIPGISHSSADAARWLPVILMWSAVALMPFGRTVEAPVLLMAAAGIVLVAREGRGLLEQPGLRVFVVVFACMWIPMLVSLADAVNPQRTTVVVVNHLRFLFAGVFMCHVLSDRWVRDRLLTLSALLLLVWMLDAGVQAVLGVDLVGREPSQGHISGPFGALSRKFGTTLAVLIPICWVFLLHRGSLWWLGVAVLASGYLVLGAGARAGWVSLLVCVVVFAVVYRGRLMSLPRRTVMAALVLAAAMPVVAYLTLDAVESRVHQSLQEITGQVPMESNPLGHRGYIWLGGLSMIQAHPVNGVGARGFRYAFADHAVPDDPFVSGSPPIMPTHSHQLLIEVTSETGLIGLAGLLLAAVIVFRAACRAPSDLTDDIAPYGIGLCAAFFPLNTHLALYSAHWSQILWWLLAAFCGSLTVSRSPVAIPETQG